MSRPRREFSLEEDNIILQATTYAQAGRLLGIDVRLVARRAVELGKSKPRWTDDRDEVLKKHYGKVSRARLMALTGMSRDQVGRRIRTLGLAMPRRWAGDETWLRENLARVGVRGAMRVLKRSKRAIEMQAWRMGLHPDEAGDAMSIRLVCDFLNVNESTLARWGVVKKGKVRPADLRAAIVDNPLRVDPRGIPGESWPTLVQLLAKRW